MPDDPLCDIVNKLDELSTMSTLVIVELLVIAILLGVLTTLVIIKL